MDDYKVAIQYFHGWLALVARGFNIDELKHIYTACLHVFLQDNEFERKIGLKEFEAAHHVVEEQLLSRMKGYATSWLESEGGSHYHEQYMQHR